MNNVFITRLPGHGNRRNFATHTQLERRASLLHSLPTPPQCRDTGPTGILNVFIHIVYGAPSPFNVKMHVAVYSETLEFRQ